MRKLLAIIERDLRKFFRNPVVMAMSVLMPLVYLLILGHSFQGKLKGLPLALVDLDGGPYARRIGENLGALHAGPRTVELIRAADEKTAVEGVKSGIYKAALIIPGDFSRDFIFKKTPEVGLFVDNTDGVSANTIRAAVESAVGAIGADYVPVRERPGELYLRDVNLYAKVDYYQSLVPGVVIMAIFLGSMTTGAFNIVMDRFLGVEESYLLAPVSRWHIVGGLIVSGLMITTVLSGLVLLVSMLITGISPISGVAQCFSIFSVIVLTTLCLLSMMFVVMGRAGHPRIVGILSGFMNVILFFPSGAVYPVESFPGWLRAFARVNPESYAVKAMKAILFKGAPLGAISADIAYLCLFTLLMMSLAVVVFKRTV